MVSVSLVAVGLLGLTACGGEKPSGLATFKPSGSGSSSASPTGTSKWTPEQQQVIDGYDRYTDLSTAIWTKAEKIDMAKVHKIATEPYATATMKEVDATLSAGFVQTGRVVNTISAVTIVGGKASIKTCYDQTHTKFTDPAHPAAPKVQIPPPSMGTVSLVREGGSWLVSDYQDGGATCVSG